MKRNIILWVGLILTIIFYSCSDLNDKNIVGYYKIDKFIPRDTALKPTIYSILNVNSNHTFELSNPTSENRINGSWKLIETSNAKEGVIQLNYEKNSVKGILNGTIFKFRFPNDFYEGHFEQVLYVKSSLR